MPPYVLEQWFPNFLACDPWKKKRQMNSSSLHVPHRNYPDTQTGRHNSLKNKYASHSHVSIYPDGVKNEDGRCFAICLVVTRPKHCCLAWYKKTSMQNYLLVSFFPADVEPSCRDLLPLSQKSINEGRHWLVGEDVWLSGGAPVQPKGAGRGWGQGLSHQTGGTVMTCRTRDKLLPERWKNAQYTLCGITSFASAGQHPKSAHTYVSTYF